MPNDGYFQELVADGDTTLNGQVAVANHLDMGPGYSKFYAIPVQSARGFVLAPRETPMAAEADAHGGALLYQCTTTREIRIRMSSGDGGGLYNVVLAPVQE